MSSLRGAIVGYGLAGSVFHGPLIAAKDGLAVATIVTSNDTRREQAAREHPEARIVSSADELWKRANEHDFAVIATTNETHAPLARAALDAGLAVVVDKPLAISAADARALIEHAASAGRLLTVFQNRRWDSDHLTLRRLIAEGALGEIRRYESRFERWRPESRSDAWREATTPAQGGGVLLDLGAHLVDQALQLFGTPMQVYGEIARRRGGAADDDAFIAIRHSSGAYSHLWMSAVAPAPAPRLRVSGAIAGFVVDRVDGQEDALRAGRRPRNGHGEWGVVPPSDWGRLVRGAESEPVPSEHGAWPAFYAEWERALREGGPAPVDPSDAVAVLEVLERVRRSNS